jgi:hypothetical protein
MQPLVSVAQGRRAFTRSVFVLEHTYDLLVAPSLRTKRPFYGSIGVAFCWVVDPDSLLVTASALENGRWVELGVWSDEVDARIPPFDATPIDVNAWWRDALPPTE